MLGKHSKGTKRNIYNKGLFKSTTRTVQAPHVASEMKEVKAMVRLRHRNSTMPVDGMFMSHGSKPRASRRLTAESSALTLVPGGSVKMTGLWPIVH